MMTPEYILFYNISISSEMPQHPTCFLWLPNEPHKNLDLYFLAHIFYDTYMHFLHHAEMISAKTSFASLLWLVMLIISMPCVPNPRVHIMMMSQQPINL